MNRYQIVDATQSKCQLQEIDLSHEQQYQGRKWSGYVHLPKLQC